MLHNTIKELARRSMSHDRVMFGESNKQHPLGFDGFIVDATVDRALLQLNSSTYDSATSLGVECDNLSRLLIESMSVNVNSSVGKLYRESKVGEIFKKVIAYIKKALKFLFVELPKKVYNKIKSFFTKKKDSAGMAKKTEENIKKTEASIKSIKKEVEAEMTVAAEALKETDELLKDTASHTEAQRDEFEKHKNDTLTRMSDRHAKASEIIQQSMKSMDDNRKRISDSADRIAALNDSLHETEDFNDKTNKIIKKSGKSYANARDTGATEFSDTMKRLDAIGVRLDELLASVDATPSHNDADTMKYREAELKMMADTLLSSIESGNAKLSISMIKEMRYFAEVFMPLVMSDKRNEFGDSTQFHVFAMNYLLRSVNALPYTTPTLTKYFKDKYKIEIFSVSSTGTNLDKSVTAVGLMYEQLKSVNKMCESLNIPKMPKFSIEVFNADYIESYIRSIRKEGDGDYRISLDALQSISSEMTSIQKDADINTLKKLEKPYDDFMIAFRNMNDSIKYMQLMDFNDVAEYIGVDPDTENADEINKGMSHILKLIKEVTDTTQKIIVSAIRCVFSMSSAEEKIVKAVVSNDDYVSSMTMTQLAHFMANDMPSLRRAWKIIHSN